MAVVGKEGGIKECVLQRVQNTHSTGDPILLGPDWEDLTNVPKRTVEAGSRPMIQPTTNL